MRCTSCGLPLSPARTITSCPRCGTPISPEKTEPWRPVAPQTPSTFPPSSSVYPPYILQPTPQLDQMRLPTPVIQGNQGSNFQQPQVQEHRQASLGGLRSGVKNQELPQAAPQYQPWQPKPPQPSKWSKNNLGFIVAGLCVLTGGLILVVVYFMSLGLPGNTTSNNAAKTNTAHSSSSPNTVSSPTSSPTATPFPGQKYIDNAQMASSIDPSSHQPTQLTTTFKANQRMYITFHLHPAGQNGAACLLWYMNNKPFFPYQLQVYSNEQATYSYASYGGTGSGYVEIYWASTLKCSDKILAQHVDFTITA